MSISQNYRTLEEFLDDIGENPRLEYVVRALVEKRREGWLGTEELLGRESEAGQILADLAFNRRDVSGFSPCNLKVQYIFDEDFVNNGSALLVFNLVATRWLHTVWLSDQNQYIFPICKDELS
jgi:hypothetical protein